MVKLIIPSLQPLLNLIDEKDISNTLSNLPLREITDIKINFRTHPSVIEKYLPQLLKDLHIKSLDLSSALSTTDRTKAINSLKNFMESKIKFSIDKLLLSKNKLNKYDALHAINLAKNHKITSLDLSSNEIDYSILTNVGAENIIYFLEYSKLKELSLNNNKLGDVVTKILALALEKSDIEILHLDNAGITEVGANALSNLLYAQAENTNAYKATLKHLSLKQNKIVITEENLNLITALNKGTLQYLDITYNPIGDMGVQALTKAAINNHAITELNFSGNHLSLVGIRNVLANLAQTNVQSLILNDNLFLADPGAGIVAQEILKSPAKNYLKALSMVNCKIGDSGGNSIAQLIEGTPYMCRLNLKGNKIGDKSLVEISATLSETSALSYLNLAFNQIGDTGISALSTALPYSAIHHLRIIGKPLTEEAIGHLSQGVMNSVVKTTDGLLNIPGGWTRKEVHINEKGQHLFSIFEAPNTLYSVAHELNPLVIATHGRNFGPSLSKISDKNILYHIASFLVGDERPEDIYRNKKVLSVLSTAYKSTCSGIDNKAIKYHPNLAAKKFAILYQTPIEVKNSANLNTHYQRDNHAEAVTSSYPIEEIIPSHPVTTESFSSFTSDTELNAVSSSNEPLDIKANKEDPAILLIERERTPYGMNSDVKDKEVAPKQQTNPNSQNDLVSKAESEIERSELSEASCYNENDESNTHYSSQVRTTSESIVQINNDYDEKSLRLDTVTMFELKNTNYDSSIPATRHSTIKNQPAKKIEVSIQTDFTENESPNSNSADSIDSSDSDAGTTNTVTYSVLIKPPIPTPHEVVTHYKNVYSKEQVEDLEECYNKFEKITGISAEAFTDMGSSSLNPTPSQSTEVIKPQVATTEVSVGATSSSSDDDTENSNYKNSFKSDSFNTNAKQDFPTVAAAGGILMKIHHLTNFVKFFGHEFGYKMEFMDSAYMAGSLITAHLVGGYSLTFGSTNSLSTQDKVIMPLLSSSIYGIERLLYTSTSYLENKNENKVESLSDFVDVCGAQTAVGGVIGLVSSLPSIMIGNIPGVLFSISQGASMAGSFCYLQNKANFSGYVSDYILPGVAAIGSYTLLHKANGLPTTGFTEHGLSGFLLNIDKWATSLSVISSAYFTTKLAAKNIDVVEKLNQKMNDLLGSSSTSDNTEEE